MIWPRGPADLLKLHAVFANEGDAVRVSEGWMTHKRNTFQRMSTLERSIRDHREEDNITVA